MIMEIFHSFSKPFWKYLRDKGMVEQASDLPLSLSLFIWKLRLLILILPLWLSW